MTQHHPATVGRQYPKAWIIGKTLEQIENVKPKKVNDDSKKIECQK